VHGALLKQISKRYVQRAHPIFSSACGLMPDLAQVILYLGLVDSVERV
jgi:hypothetical protein